MGTIVQGAFTAFLRGKDVKQWPRGETLSCGGANDWRTDKGTCFCIKTNTQVFQCELIFQQDGAWSHTSNHTLAYFKQKLPYNAMLLPPNDWPPHSWNWTPWIMGYGHYWREGWSELKSAIWNTCVLVLVRSGLRSLRMKSIKSLCPSESVLRPVLRQRNGILSINCNDNIIFGQFFSQNLTNWRIHIAFSFYLFLNISCSFWNRHFWG